MAKNNKRYNRGGSERIHSGINGFDHLIEGGFVRNSTIMIQGDVGTGKSIFCLQYLYKGAMEKNEPGIYITFSESEKTVIQHGESFGWNMEKLRDENKLVIIRYEPHEVANIMAQGGGSLRDTMESIGAKRLTFDSLTAYRMVFETQYKANESILDLFELLRKWGSTALVTSESPVTPTKESGGQLGFLTDGLINLYRVKNSANRARALEIIKMRDTDHDNKIYSFCIGKGGLKMSGRL